MQATDFFLYCLGISVVLVSTAGALRLMSPSRPKVSKEQPAPKWEPVPDPTDAGLHGRLQAFQSARYASPIVKRQLGEDVGPRQRPPVAPPPIPIRRPAPPRDPEGDKVVPLPVKMKPKKEE